MLANPPKSNIISNPAHYVEGRTIEPIQVIETFSLCHHLACVVKYLARAGRKTSLINDLEKASWYLARELSLHTEGHKTCTPYLSKTPQFEIQAIIDDWKLSANLGEVLNCILSSRQLYSSSKNFQWLKQICLPRQTSEIFDQNIPLIRALEFLRLEIAQHGKGASA